MRAQGRCWGTPWPSIRSVVGWPGNGPRSRPGSGRACLLSAHLPCGHPLRPCAPALPRRARVSSSCRRWRGTPSCCRRLPRHQPRPPPHPPPASLLLLAPPWYRPHRRPRPSASAPPEQLQQRPSRGSGAPRRRRPTPPTLPPDACCATGRPWWPPPLWTGEDSRLGLGEGWGHACTSVPALAPCSMPLHLPCLCSDITFPGAGASTAPPSAAEPTWATLVKQSTSSLRIITTGVPAARSPATDSTSGRAQQQAAPAAGGALPSWPAAALYPVQPGFGRVLQGIQRELKTSQSMPQLQDPSKQVGGGLSLSRPPCCRVLGRPPRLTIPTRALPLLQEAPLRGVRRAHNSLTWDVVVESAEGGGSGGSGSILEGFLEEAAHLGKLPCRAQAGRAADLAALKLHGAGAQVGARYPVPGQWLWLVVGWMPSDLPPSPAGQPAAAKPAHAPCRPTSRLRPTPRCCPSWLHLQVGGMTAQCCRQRLQRCALCLHWLTHSSLQSICPAMQVQACAARGAWPVRGAAAPARPARPRGGRSGRQRSCGRATRCRLAHAR